MLSPGLTYTELPAGKTGTQQWGNTADNQDAWMAGYTPQLAAVVWVGRPIPGPMRNQYGYAIEGKDTPASIWGVSTPGQRLAATSK